MVKDLPKQMSNRKPKKGEAPVRKLKLSPGESKQWQCMTDDGPILATIWQETKKRNPVCLISSNTDPTSPATTVQQKQKDGTRKDVPSPLAVDLYNKHMNGVDQSDQSFQLPVVLENGGLTCFGFLSIFAFPMPLF